MRRNDPLIAAIITALLIVPFLAWGASFNGSLNGAVGSSGVCSTPDNGDLFDEGFLTAGFESANFTTTINGSGSIDLDYDISGLGTPPADVCSEGAEIIAQGGQTYISYNHGSQIDSTQGTTVLFHFYISAGGISIDDASQMEFFQENYNSSPIGDDPASKVLIERQGTVYTYKLVGVTLGTAVFDAWQTIEVHTDSGASASWAKLNGGSPVTFTQQAGKNKRYVHMGGGGYIGATEKITAYIGYAYANTTE